MRKRYYELCKKIGHSDLQFPITSNVGFGCTQKVVKLHRTQLEDTGAAHLDRPTENSQKIGARVVLHRVLSMRVEHVLLDLCPSEAPQG